MFNVNWNSKEREAIGIAACLVSMCGVWSVEKDDGPLKIRWFISIICMVVLVSQASYESYLGCVTWERNAENAYSVTFGLIGLSKVFFCFLHRAKLRTNVNSIVEDWASEDAKKYSVIMNNCKRNYTKFIRFFLSIGMVTCCMYLLKIFVIDPDSMVAVERHGNTTMILKKRFPLPAGCYFSDVSPLLYWIIIIAQSLEFVIAFGTIWTCDLFFTAIASHLCTQFEILKMKFASLANTGSVAETNDRMDKLIARHKHLLGLGQNIEAAFTMILFIQMVINVIILNVAGLNVLVLLKRGETLSAMSSASVMTLSLVQTFMYSYIGDMLASQGSDIAQAMYESEWYSLPPSFAKKIIFVMARTNCPTGLTAGKFFRMTRSTFTNIVKTAASYLSVLRIMIRDDV